MQSDHLGEGQAGPSALTEDELERADTIYGLTFPLLRKLAAEVRSGRAALRASEAALAEAAENRQGFQTTIEQLNTLLSETNQSTAKWAKRAVSAEAALAEMARKRLRTCPHCRHSL